MKTFKEWVKKRIREEDSSTDVLGKVNNIFNPPVTGTGTPVNINALAKAIITKTPTLNKALTDLNAMNMIKNKNKPLQQPISPISPISPSAPAYGGIV
jgi:hypothetical protein